MSGSERIRVLIADDHPVVRLGMETVLRTQPDIQLVGQVADGDEAVRQARLTRPDVVVLDLCMPVKDGLAALVEIKRALPAARCLIHSSLDEAERVVQAVSLGAAGYLLKEAAPTDLLGAIRAASRGEIALHPTATRQLVKAYQALQGAAVGGSDLTPAEQRVLTMLTRGLSNRELAAALGVSVRTVTTHIGHILDKLGVENRVQAALYAREHGLAA